MKATAFIISFLFFVSACGKMSSHIEADLNLQDETQNFSEQAQEEEIGNLSPSEGESEGSGSGNSRSGGGVSGDKKEYLTD